MSISRTGDTATVVSGSTGMQHLRRQAKMSQLSKQIATYKIQKVKL